MTASAPRTSRSSEGGEAPAMAGAPAENNPSDSPPILVIVSLYGGNDGLNTVIPYTDGAYYDARPGFAYDVADTIGLDGHLGLNPALTGLGALWADEKLAIVHGVSYPNPDHSHFRSMDIWQSASPAQPVGTGWIGRWLDTTGGDPLRAISIGSVLPLVALGEKYTALALTEAAWPPPTPADTALAALGTADPQDDSARSAVRLQCRAADTLRGSGIPLPAITATATNDQPVVARACRYDPSNRLAAQLQIVARCIKADMPTRVYIVELGGFDTHADQLGTQQSLLGLLDEGMCTFLRDMDASGNGKNVVVLAYSEFGRRVAANTSQGTDHGTAGPLFVAGNPVKGGFYGEHPSLTDLDDGDLKGTVDFRDVYHELLVNTLGADPVPVIGGGRAELGFLHQPQISPRTQ